MSEEMSAQFYQYFSLKNQQEKLSQVFPVLVDCSAPALHPQAVQTIDKFERQLASHGITVSQGRVMIKQLMHSEAYQERLNRTIRLNEVAIDLEGAPVRRLSRYSRKLSLSLPDGK